MFGLRFKGEGTQLEVGDRIIVHERGVLRICRTAEDLEINGQTSVMLLKSPATEAGTLNAHLIAQTLAAVAGLPAECVGTPKDASDLSGAWVFELQDS